jgi:hypothetical protein
MKNLIFVDNDNQAKAESDLGMIKNRLLGYFKQPQDYVDTISIITDIHKKSTQEMYDLFFNPDNCICTFSVYTANHYGSLHQMMGLLAAAGDNYIKDIIHIDTSGMILKALNNNIINSKRPLSILNAIETNNILTIDYENMCGVRVRVKLTGNDNDIFVTEPIAKFEDLFV